MTYSFLGTTLDGAFMNQSSYFFSCDRCLNIFCSIGVDPDSAFTDFKDFGG